MKKAIILILLSCLFLLAWMDIGPNPIHLKSITTHVPCEIQMVSETVNIELFEDSSYVSCSFHMYNHGDSITLPIGFPVMNFQYWSMGGYEKNDKTRFEILVDDKLLTANDIQVPDGMKPTYQKYMDAYRADELMKHRYDSIKLKYGVVEKRNGKRIFKNIKDYNGFNAANQVLIQWRKTKPSIDSDLYEEFDRLTARGDYPWYVWMVTFRKGESRKIKVNYMVPYGATYRDRYRFVKYMLSTGSGWKDKIEKATVTLRLNDMSANDLNKIKPANHVVNEHARTVMWVFRDLEPTPEDDIYVEYSTK